MRHKIITTLKDYQSSYSDRLENHLKEYEDYDELHFIKEELEKYKIYYATADVQDRKIAPGSDPEWPNKEYEYCHDLSDTDDTWNYEVMMMIKDYDSPSTNYFNIELCEKLSYSFSRIISFLKTLQNEVVNPIIGTRNSSTPISTLNWAGTDLELSELIKALVLSNKLNPELSQKEIFRRFRDFLNWNDFNENDKLKDIRKRTNTPTPFINILETSLSNWIKAKD